MDGPDHEKLFRQMGILNAETNLKEIVKYLRFTKDEGTYQQYLKHYIPMLAKPGLEKELQEFIPDLEDKELAQKLGYGPPAETVEEKPEDQEEESIDAPKKVGRPKKVL